MTDISDALYTNYLGHTQKTALQQMATLVDGTEHNVMLVVGPDGTGKTFLGQLLKELRSEKTRYISVSNPHLTPEALLDEILETLRVPQAKGRFGRKFERTHSALKTHAKNNNRVMLCIDHAEQLPNDTLLLIQTLAGFVIDAQPLLRIFLKGDHNLLNVLDYEELSELKEHIESNLELAPFTDQESKDYLSFLSQQDDEQPMAITDIEAATLHYFSGGFPLALANLSAALRHITESNDTDTPPCRLRKLLLGSSWQHFLCEHKPLLDYYQDHSADSYAEPALIQIAAYSDNRPLLEPTRFDKAHLWIGRSDECEVVLKDRTVSRRHVFLEFKSGEIHFTNVNPANPVTVNGKTRVKGVLRNGSVLWIGGVSVTVLLTSLNDAPLLPMDEADALEKQLKKSATSERANREHFSKVSTQAEIPLMRWLSVAAALGVLIPTTLFWALKSQEAKPTVAVVSQQTPTSAGTAPEVNEIADGNLADNQLEPPPIASQPPASKDKELVEVPAAYRPNTPHSSPAPAQHEIDTLLKVAAAQIDRGNRYGPPGDNARETYQQILAIDPHNEAAKAGLAAIAKTFEQLALKQIQGNALKAALGSIEEGLYTSPDNAALLQLKQQVTTKLGSY